MANKAQANLKYYKGYGKNIKSLREMHQVDGKICTVRQLSEIFSQNGIGISYSTISDIENERREPTVEQVQIYHDFFNVPFDFLTGETKTQKKSLIDICNYTGLSEKAIESLVILKNKSDSRAYIDLLSCIIADCNFEYFLGLLEGYIVPNSQETTASFSMSSVTFNNKDICAFAASNALRNILENVEDEFLSEYQTTQDRLNILTKELYRRAGIQYNGNDK